MSDEKSYIAIDLGASSGRAILGRFNGAALELEEIHRFENGPIEKEDGYHWDTERLFAEIKTGISKAVVASAGTAGSVGVDSWGVDYGLIAPDGRLLRQPFSYRDSRTDGMVGKAFGVVPRDEIFAATGIQFMQINTLFQLLADMEQGSGILEQADCLLLMADLFNYMLTGKRASEHTLASTSQCFNPSTGTWALDMVERFGMPRRIFPEVVEAGSVLGWLRPEIGAEVGAQGLPVVAVAAHDTASAVAATPAKGAGFAYMSLGTWSLLGTELSAPVLTDLCREHNFTNEGGVFGTTRLLKNATGLWIVQECRRLWAEAGEELSFSEMAEMASGAEPFTAFIDPDADIFQTPGDMPARICSFCRDTKQKVPADKAAILRVAFESLALKSRLNIEQLEEVCGKHVGVLHIVGGGTQNKVLVQMIADAVGRQVLAGPVEATALGSIMLQMIALEDIQTVEEGRAMVRRSVALETFDPAPGNLWEVAGERMKALLAGYTR